MGARLPDGRYMGDNGKIYRNYNDALAESRTRQSRATQEALLDQSRRYYQYANDQAYRDQRNKNWFGWIPGAGWAYDRSLERSLNDKAAAAEAIRAREGQLAIHKAAMGEGATPPTIDRIPGAPALPPAPASGPGPGQSAPVAYGDPAARARESEQRRMMQQYASKEYWDTEQGKAMKDLAMQDRYEGKDLAKFYQAQQATGIGSIDEIVSAMGYTGDMEKWARANQGLALREYLKKSPKGFSNDPAMGTLPQGYENAVATYEAHGAPQISVDQAMQAELEKARKAGYSDEQIRAQLSSTQMGLPVGSEAGAVAAVNREKLQELQGIVPQAALTGAGKGAMSMQPESAVPLAVTYSAPQGLELGNIPKASSEEIASNLARVWNQKLRNGFANG